MGARTPDTPVPGSPADLQVEADPEDVARTVLLRRLTAAPRTRQDLRADLLRRNIPEDVADRVLDRFVDVGLINDAAYAQLYVESRQRSRASAGSALRHELRSKGVPEDIVAATVECIDPEAERDRARELVRVKARSTAHLEPVARIRRLTTMLQRRGYSSSVAYAVVRDVLGELPDDAA